MRCAQAQRGAPTPAPLAPAPPRPLPGPGWKRGADDSVRDGAPVRAGVTVVGNLCRLLGTGAGGSGLGLFQTILLVPYFHASMRQEHRGSLETGRHGGKRRE